jgi:hypothetical protein
MIDVLPYPLINGYEPSFCSIEVKIVGSGVVLPLPGIKAINYSDPLTRSTIYGHSVHPAGRTRGQLKPAGSIEFYKRQWTQVVDVLTSNGLWGIAERSWGVTVMYGELGMTPTVDLLDGVSLHSPDMSNSEGTEASVVKCTLDIMAILWNGKNRSLSAGSFTVGRVG